MAANISVRTPNRTSGRGIGRRPAMWLILLSLPAGSFSAYAGANRIRRDFGGSPNLAAETTRSGHTVEVPIERDAAFGTLLVRAQVEGNAAVLILDTGSNVTSLSNDIIGENQIDLRIARAPVRGLGIVGEGRWTTTTLAIGGGVWINRPVVVRDLRPVSSAYRQRIGGILGLDFLSSFKDVEIDFAHHRLVLTP